MTRTWIWPISWYFRIKALEEENAVLWMELKEAREQLRAEVIANTLHNSMMASLTTSVLSNAYRSREPK